MNQRERVLAVVLLVVIFIGGGGFAGYLLFYRSFRNANLRMQKLQQDVAANERKLGEMETSLPRLQQLKKMSLPADVNLAQREYEAEMSRLLRQAEFAGGTPTITAKPVEKRETVTAAKRLPFIRLSFDIEARGELASVVAFLDAFYRLPLLHRIKTISIVRQATTGQGGTPALPGMPGREQRQNDLVLTASIEALVLDGAEKRDKLVPDGVKPPERLAHTKEQYVSIAGRNIFYGPPPPPAPVVERDTKPRSEVDVTEFVVLDEITHDSDRGVQASLYDAFNNYKYFIRQLNDGSFLISTFYYIKDTKKRLNVGEELEIQGDTGETQVAFRVVRIDATNVLLQETESGKYCLIHIGLNMKDAKVLTTSEAKALGLKVADEKKAPEAGDDKKAPDKGSEAVNKAPPPKPVKDEGK